MKCIFARAHAQRLLVLLLLCCSAVSIHAYSFQVDGIYYNKTSDNEVSVTRTTSYNSYSGTINIPSEVVYNNTTYRVTSIGTSAFFVCIGLKEVTIPNSVTSIGGSAFEGCTGLTEVTIPNGVTSIGGSAFEGCTGLTKVHISDIAAWCKINFADFYSNPLRYAHHLYVNGEKITNLVIPNSVTSIGNRAFYSCTGLTEVTIPNSVTSIGGSAFEGCTGLTEVTIPNSVTSIGSEAFSGCTGLPEVTIPNSVTSIGEKAFNACTSLKKVHISDLAAWCKIKFPYTTANPLYYAQHLYLNGEEIKHLVIPNSVTSISDYAFSGCTGFEKITVAEGNPTYDSRDGCNAIIVTNSSELLIGCKNTKISRNVKSIEKHAFCNIKQIYLTIPNSVTFIGEYAFDECSGTLIFEHTTPPSVYSTSLYDMQIYIPANTLAAYQRNSTWSQIPMKELSITLPSQTTPTTATLNTSKTNIGSRFTFNGEYLTFNGKKYYPQNHQVKLTGLEPDTIHHIPFYGNVDERITIEANVIFQTTSLEMATSQPKVVSAGNVIVAAETNIDDDESNVGFEWRRTDWSDDFVSNTGNAYVYNGVMEGYIRNLYTEKLWKYRPYYVSAQGNYYYGEWVGIDPTNTSYFEPTVHTYASVSVNGNTAAVKGYALTGTDKVTSQGFKYWKTAADAKDRDGMNRVAAVPSDAMTIEASGQVMTATLVGLDYNATYHYAAFVTTAEGDTFYGEEQSFATGEDPSGIGGVPYSEPKPVTIVARYNMNGQPLSAPQKGINLLKMSDGTVKKVLVK